MKLQKNPHSETFLRVMRRQRRRRLRKRLGAALAAGTLVVSIASVASASSVSSGGRALVPVVPTWEPVTISGDAEDECGGCIIEWTTEEAYLLAKLAVAEAESEDTEGKALVMCVVINRMLSESFPNTITDVIYEDGAFSSISDGRFDRVEPNMDSFRALEMVLIEYWDQSDGALYFEVTPDEGTTTWHSRNLEKLFVHGAHTFYTEGCDEA